MPLHRVVCLCCADGMRRGEDRQPVWLQLQQRLPWFGRQCWTAHQTDVRHLQSRSCSSVRHVTPPQAGLRCSAPLVSGTCPQSAKRIPAELAAKTAKRSEIGRLTSSQQLPAPSSQLRRRCCSQAVAAACSHQTRPSLDLPLDAASVSCWLTASFRSMLNADTRV